MSETIAITGDLARHPMSEAYPEMSPDEFDTLLRSMIENGYDPNFPIMLHEGQIVDGWHRYRAAMKANIEPVVVEWQGDPKRLRDFIIYANSTRRHLSKAAHAQALIRMRELGGKELTDKQIENIAGVSASIVSEQKRLRAQNPDRANRVADGNEPPQTAVREVLNTPTETQRRGTAWSGTLSRALTRRMAEAARLAGETEKRFVINAVEERIRRLSD